MTGATRSARLITSAELCSSRPKKFLSEERFPTQQPFGDMAVVFNDPAHWRTRALEAKALADTMTDAEGRSRMIAIAQEYDHLADRANARLKANAMAGVGFVLKQ
jgi:hypothetical protein